MKTDNAIFFVILSVVALGCSTASEESSEMATSSGPAVTEEQLQLANVQTDQLQYKLITSVVSCTGEIEVPPQGMASVTAPLGGYIVDTDMVPGRFVKKGFLLATLSNPEYIVLQQSYLETAGQLKFASQEHERQKLLDEQNATALKKLQESESSFKVLSARLAGLKEQLKMVGVSIGDLEKGNIQSKVPLRAPLSGYVTEVNHHPGQFVGPSEVVFEIVDVSDLHLHLNIFEKDIAKIGLDQSIRFRPAGGNGDFYWGRVSLVSPQRNATLRTFDVHGHIDKESDRLKPGMYVEAEVLISSDSVYAVQEKSVIKRGSEAYVLAEKGESYEIVAVDTGASMDGWIEVRNHEALRHRKIVTEGASRLFTALQR